MPRDVALELGKEEGRKIVLDEVKSRNRRQLGNFSVAGAKVSKRLGDNYRGIVREIMCFEDTFGLCGVMAIHAAGMLSSPETWDSVMYDPRKLKLMFDRKMDRNVGHIASEVFKRKYRGIIPGGYHNLCIRTPDEMNQVFDSLPPKNGLIVALICEYERHGGLHTHWLAAERTHDKSRVLLTGDLTPFDIRNFAITVPLDNLAISLTKVLDTSPSTILSQRLEAPTQRMMLLGENNKFFNNVMIFKFASNGSPAS